MRENPQASNSNLSGSISCVRNSLSNNPSSSRGIGLIVDYVKNSAGKGNPLSEGGTINLQNSIRKMMQEYDGVIIANTPRIFNKNNLDNTGSVKIKRQKKNIESINKYIKRYRNYYGIPHHKLKPKIYLVRAEFTRYDSSNTDESGGAEEGTIKGTDGKLIIRPGRNSGMKSIGLTVSLIDPSYNVISNIENFSVNVFSERKEFKLKVGIGELFFGLADKTGRVEGIHAAQEVLVDAAALWLINNVFGKHARVPQCLAPDQRIILG